MLSAAEVLEFHTEIMRCYDNHWETEIFCANTDEEKLVMLKQSMHQATTYSIPYLACLNKNFPTSFVKKETITAYEIALEAVKDINNLADYHRTFRKAYDSALRIELYRHFLSKVALIPLNIFMTKQSFDDLSDFLSPNLTEFVESVEAQIKTEFAQFQAISSNFTELDLATFKRLETQLGEYLQTFKNTLAPFKTSSTAEIRNQCKFLSDVAFELEKKAGKLIRSHQIHYEHDVDWTPFLKNLALNLMLIATGVGAFASLGLLIYKVATGRHAFFDNPMLLKRTSIAAEEQLLFPEENDPYGFFNQGLGEQQDIQSVSSQLPY